MQYVYVLLCNDGRTYVGCTGDLKKRLNRHNEGGVRATLNRLPVKLIFYSGFNDQYKAFEFERYLNTGSVRAFMHKRFL